MFHDLFKRLVLIDDVLKIKLEIKPARLPSYGLIGLTNRQDYQVMA